MAYFRVNTGQAIYVGLSSDEKPAEASEGTRLLELDTGRDWYFRAGTWVGDEGRPVEAKAEELLSELLRYQKAAVLGLSLLTNHDLIGEVKE